MFIYGAKPMLYIRPSASLAASTCQSPCTPRRVNPGQPGDCGILQVLSRTSVRISGRKPCHQWPIATVWPMDSATDSLTISTTKSAGTKERLNHRGNRPISLRYSLWTLHRWWRNTYPMRPGKVTRAPGQLQSFPRQERSSGKCPQRHLVQLKYPMRLYFTSRSPSRA